MTDFEKRIKRGMTEKKFKEICKHKFAKGKDAFFGETYTYGNVGSWFTWNRKESGQIQNEKPPKGCELFTNNRAFYDGPIEEWKEHFSSILTTDIIFLGLNMAHEGKPMPGPKFQNARGVKRIVYTFFDTKAEGAYFTDIFKSDKRLLVEGKNPANSDEFLRIVRENEDVIPEHINLFEEELKFIGADKPLLITFGGAVDWYIRQSIKRGFLKENTFHAIINIGHYAPTNSIKGGDLGYIIDTSEKLSKWITIPCDEKSIREKMKQLGREGDLVKFYR